MAVEELNQVSLAWITQISPSHLSRMVNGTRNASPEVARNFADALNVPPKERDAFFLLAVGYSMSDIPQSTEAPGILGRLRNRFSK